MGYIRKAALRDVSRIAEILVFTKRMNYRRIFHNDKVSFGEIQVVPLAEEYIANPEMLENIWVYDDEFVKGMIHIEGKWIKELYVDCFFQNNGIGAMLIDFAIQKFDVRWLFVLEKNDCGNPLLSKPWFCADTETADRRRNNRDGCENGKMSSG